MPHTVPDNVVVHLRKFIVVSKVPKLVFSAASQPEKKRTSLTPSTTCSSVAPIRLVCVGYIMCTTVKMQHLLSSSPKVAAAARTQSYSQLWRGPRRMADVIGGDKKPHL